MSIRTTARALIAPIAAVALLLAGCGSSGKAAATSTAPAPTATMVGSGTPPGGGIDAHLGREGRADDGDSQARPRR